MGAVATSERPVDVAPEAGGEASSATDRGLSRLSRFAPRSFRSKIVLSTVGLMTVAMLLVGLGIQLLLGYTAQRDITQVLNSRSATVISAVRGASAQRLVVPGGGIDPGAVVYDADGRFVGGSVELEARDAAEDLSRVTAPTFREGPGGRERLLGVPFTTSSGAKGVVVVSQDAAAYERSEFYALVATGTVALLVVLATGLIALRVTRQALAPVSQMAERAAEWSEHDLSHRFDLGPPTNELAALGETLDHLLGRVASAILSEQRLTAELAHELRTPLTSILGSADLALMRGVDDPQARRDIEQIATSAREMTIVISTLLDIARENAPSESAPTCTAHDVLAQLGTPGTGTGTGLVTVVVDGAGSTATIAAPCQLVVRAAAPVLENALRYARGTVVVTARDRPGRVELLIADDGPGVAADLRDTLFEPGVTLGPGGGAGLGLGIARRVARSIGGELEVGTASDGAVFVLRLPRRDLRA